MINSTPQVVTIAGSDSGGGAGAQADLKTFQARQVFGTSIFVALTAQNTLGVQAVHPVPTEFIKAQFESLASDLHIRAAKTGMLADSRIVQAVVESYKVSNFGPLVVDPVMIAKGGHPLLAEEAIETIKEKLLPIATVCTPNLPEAECLVGHPLQTREEIVEAQFCISGYVRAAFRGAWSPRQSIPIHRHCSLPKPSASRCTRPSHLVRWGILC